MLISFLALSLWSTGTLSAQHYFKTKDARVSFYSSAPIEDIQAVSKKGISVLDMDTGELVFELSIRSLQFPKQKMEDHFNENFMESDRYPKASFRGRIKGNPNLAQPGSRSVVLKGILEIHGQKDQREIPATIRVTGNQLTLSSEFKVACKDHHIKIPKILWKNIAEVVQITVNAEYTR